MYVQRLRQMMIQVYKVHCNIGPVYIENLFNKVDQFYNTRCIESLAQPYFNTIAYGCIYIYISMCERVKSF